MPAIYLNSLSKKINSVKILKDISFEIDEGEVFGFLGPNGAGKSTTISILLGLIRPTSGVATVLGHDVETERDEIHSQVGVLPDGVAPFTGLSGTQHVEFAARAHGVSVDPAELLDYTGLDPADHDRPVENYSTGMRQRLWLAMALVGDPELIVLDEPMTGLDPNGVREVREIVGNLASDGHTVFFSSHRLGEVQTVCDRVGVLYDGQVRRIADVDELGGSEIGSLYTVRFEIPTPNERLFADIRSREDVRRAEYDGEWLRVESASPTEKVEVTETVLSETSVSNIVAEQSSLESLFARETDSTEVDQ
ncbi:ABC transporter ATP-binding protein [Halobaculum sp. MBLA0143]|uniref:ABC transporter ATP-binding protein n=1 Tax=Halobaculum sp. MBLA0143 TaxID=3079933 RepID=UPI00352475CB